MDIEQAVRIVATLCIKFEGVYLRPYLCPAGVPTIGVGATFYEDGRKVSLNDPPITRERAIQLLHFHIRRHFLPKTVRLCPGADTPARVAALCDFAFNLGHGALAGSTLRRKVNAGEWEEARVQILRWTRAGGRVLRGLVRRRQAEEALL
jgi:lysozyme